MSSPSTPNTVEPYSEPERVFNRNLRERSRAVALAIEIEEVEVEDIEVTMGDRPPGRTFNDLSRPSLVGMRPSITRPAVEANNFEIKSSTIQMIQTTCQFDGRSDEDPNDHLARFLAICATFSIHGVSDDAIRLRVFPFTLRERARTWLDSLPAGSITTWDQMAEKFLLKYFPPSKTTKLRNKITSFEQDEGESLYDAWERFKDMLRKCPQHGLDLWVQIQTFYNGLYPHCKQAIDASAGGTFGNKTPEDVYDLIEEISMSSDTWQGSRGKGSRQGMYHVDTNTSLAAEMAALSSKFDQLQAHVLRVSCDLCGGPPNTDVKHTIDRYISKTSKIGLAV